MNFALEIVKTRDVAVLRCRGRLVVEHGASELSSAGRQELSNSPSLALDLACVTQMDARGTGVVAGLCRTAQQTGRRLVLIDASDRVLRLLRLTRLDTVLPLRDAAGAREVDDLVTSTTR